MAGLPDIEGMDDEPQDDGQQRPITPPPDEAAYGGMDSPYVEPGGSIPIEPIGRPIYPPPDEADIPPIDALALNPAMSLTGRQRVQAGNIHGPLYAFCGKVLKVYYDASPAVHPDTKRGGDVDVQMVDINWTASTNVPVLTAKMRGNQEPTPNMVVASPWPAREDQPKYVVKAGDDVTVLASADGRYYFMADDLPFVGQVQMGEDEDAATGSNFDGAGNHWIKVRRVQLSGNPALTEGYIYDGTKTAIVYPYVQVERAACFHHGYRPIYDYVLVHRRGRYFFAVPALNSRMGMIVAAGPSEGNFTTNHYWVKIIALKATYSGDNAWTEADTAVVKEFSWVVDAKNLGEADDEHVLEVGDEVVLHLFANADTGQAAEFAPYWVIDKGKSGKVDTPYEMLPLIADIMVDTAQTDTWDRATPPTGKKGVIYRGPRTIYNATSATYRLYTRNLTYDSRGSLKAISAESVTDITPTTLCP